MDNVLRIVYSYSRNDWCTVLTPLTHNEDFELKLYSKFIVCHVIGAFPHDDLQHLLKLDESDIDILTNIMLGATTKSQDGTVQPFSSKDVVSTIRFFIAHNNYDMGKHFKIPISNCLSAMLKSDSKIDRQAAYKFLFEAQLKPALKKLINLPMTLLDDCIKSDDMWIQGLLEASLNNDSEIFLSVVMGLSESLISVINEVATDQLTHGVLNSSLSDMLDIMLRLSSIDTSRNFISVVDREFPSSQLIEAMYQLTSKVFDGKIILISLFNCVMCIDLLLYRMNN